MKQHFVKFLSPGTFVSEETTKSIDSWDVEKAKIMALDVLERHSSKPYGFQFITRGREENELDSKIIDSSNIYYLGGYILTLEEVKDKNDPNDSILISNMKCNNWDRIIVNNNSWKFTAPFHAGDVVLSI